MNARPPVRLVQIFSVLSLVLTLTLNALSTTVPLNGRNPAQISARYNTLLVPENMTFIIWAFIYGLLICYVVRIQMKLNWLPADQQPRLIRQGWLFSLTGLLNASWILAWHFYQMRLSLGIMLMLLVTLLMVLADLPRELPLRQSWLVRLPFTVYTGWISMTIIINTATVLVSTGWTGGWPGPVFWTVLMLAASVIVGWLVLLKFRDISFILAQAWAISGILIHHLTFYRSSYPLIIDSAIAALVLLGLGIIASLLRKLVKPVTEPPTT